QPREVRLDRQVLRRRRGQPREARHLVARDLAGRGGELRLLGARADGLDLLRPLRLLAELPADLAQLLAQERLPRAPLEVRLHLLRQLAAELSPADRVPQALLDEPEP